MISRFRPTVPIIGAAHDRRTCRKLALSWGVRPVCVGGGQKTVDDVLSDVMREALADDFVAGGDRVVATAGTPLFKPGTTNLIQILKLPEASI